MKLNVYSEIDTDDFYQIFRDMAESISGKTFNKEAEKIIDVLLYRSGTMGEEKDLIKKINKLTLKYGKR